MQDIYEIDGLAEPLCRWYQKNKRSMPWREAATPYHVWLSEIMLQQTRIEAAKAYYERFIERLPDVKALAGVPEEELMKLWEGLGYYNRARNLQKAAKLVVERYDGVLPADYDLLLELPGIGNYTAGAIASIAYHIPAPAVDGNVLRVLMRYLNCRDDISKAAVRKKTERSVMKIIPEDKPGDFNEALMELGEVVCIPNGAPLCGQCPVAETCQGRIAGTQTELPVKPEKKARRVEKKTILIFLTGERVGIARRPETGLLAGLWEFPSLSGHLTMKQTEEYLKQKGVQPAGIRRLKSGRHIFSHVEWHMKGYLVEIMPEQDQDTMREVVPDIVWTEKENLSKQYTVPVAFHSFLKQIFA